MVAIEMKTTILLILASAAIAGASPDYQLHEWGTFTTVSGSDGVLLSGLDREEEFLPPLRQAVERIGEFLAA